MRKPIVLPLFAGWLLGSLFVALVGVGQFGWLPQPINWRSAGDILRWAFVAALSAAIFPGAPVAYFCLRFRWLGVREAAVAAGFVATTFVAVLAVLIFQSVNRTSLLWGDILTIGWYGAIGGAGGFVCWFTLWSTGAFWQILPKAPKPPDWVWKAVVIGAVVASAVVLALPSLVLFRHMGFVR